MKVREIVRVTRGKLLSGSADYDVTPSRISTDSRTIRKGDFFLALSGRNFDGNRFVHEAIKKRAIGAIATRVPANIKDSRVIMITVADTTKALQDIAHCHRMRYDIPLIGVTGSNGKTTVKEMVAGILSKKYSVLKNEGTKNNHIGVPQTLLKLEKRHQICVLEFGANHKGEIRNLSRVANPTIALITNIGPSHLEFFGDLKGVFEVKREILEDLNKEGLAIINGDDEFLSKIRSRRFRVIRFGFAKANDFRARLISSDKERIRFVLNEKYEYELGLLGNHNIYNALAAIAAASQFGVSYKFMREALASYKPTYRRLDREEVNGIDIINDSYNSNPLSMKAALEALEFYPAKAKWIVSGDMLELGDDSVRFHKMIGSSIANSGIEGLITLGSLSRHTSSQARKEGMGRLWHCSTHDEAARILKKIAKKGDAVLLKGSRSMKMEEIIERLKD